MKNGLTWWFYMCWAGFRRIGIPATMNSTRSESEAASWLARPQISRKSRPSGDDGTRPSPTSLLTMIRLQGDCWADFTVALSSVNISSSAMFSDCRAEIHSVRQSTSTACPACSAAISARASLFSTHFHSGGRRSRWRAMRPRISLSSVPVRYVAT